MQTHLQQLYTDIFIPINPPIAHIQFFKFCLLCSREFRFFLLVFFSWKPFAFFKKWSKVVHTFFNNISQRAQSTQRLFRASQCINIYTILSQKSEYLFMSLLWVFKWICIHTHKDGWKFLSLLIPLCSLCTLWDFF